jgi:hypothetical protein
MNYTFLSFAEGGEDLHFIESADAFEAGPNLPLTQFIYALRTNLAQWPGLGKEENKKNYTIFITFCLLAVYKEADLVG